MYTHTHHTHKALPIWVSLTGLDCVGGADELTPVGDGLVSRDDQGNDGTTAHVGYQTGKEQLAIVLCIQVAGLLWRQMDSSLLLIG